MNYPDEEIAAEVWRMRREGRRGTALPGKAKGQLVPLAPADDAVAAAEERPPPLTLAEWLDRDLPEPDRVLGDLLSTTSRVLIVGPTGLGKTMFGIAAAMAMAEGQAFLHWKAGRKCRVLYVDGEISRREMKRRLRDAARASRSQTRWPLHSVHGRLPGHASAQHAERAKMVRCLHRGARPFRFHHLRQRSGAARWQHEGRGAVGSDPAMGALTHPEINRTNLVSPYRPRRNQELWLKGPRVADGRRGPMERVEIPGADLAFSLKFTKARERTPENRADFEPVTMQLMGDQWQSGSPPKSSKLTPDTIKSTAPPQRGNARWPHQ